MKQTIFFGRGFAWSAVLKTVIIAACGLPLLFLASCKHDDLEVAKPNENVRAATDFVKNNYELRLFHAALLKTGYADQLNGPGPFTVLAPTDDAFNAIGIFNASDFDKLNQDTLKKVIGYHILPRLLRLSSIPSNGVDVRYATLEGTELYASLASTNQSGASVGNWLYFSGAFASRKDVALSNGTLHVLSKVMKPNFKTTVQQWLANHKDYSVFVKGLKKFDLWEQLNGNGPFTVFAPDDAALAKVGITSASLDLLDKNLYVGSRLFGAYILYNKHFFISDSQIFTLINSGGYFNYTLKDDNHEMEFVTFPENSGASLYYQLMLKDGGLPFPQILKTLSVNYYHKVDNLCSNGLVHYVQDGLVTPAQALKK